jgi:hypothetical protein
MKIDLSTIFMLTAFFIPGLIFRRSRNRVVPRSLLAKGATEEIAELAGFALLVHVGIFLAFCVSMAFIGAWRMDRSAGTTQPRSQFPVCALICSFSRWQRDF